MKRFASIWFPHWATDLFARKAETQSPFVLVERDRHGLCLAAIDIGAHALGLSVGQRLADALAAIPHLVTHPFDLALTQAALARMADEVRRWSPLTAVDGPDGVVIDLTGACHLFGGEEGVLKDMAARLGKLGFQLRTAIADTAGAAWAWARYGGGGILPPGAARQMLAALPVAALRLAVEVLEGLHHLGLRRIGDLMALPRGPLATRFGREAMLRLDQVLGRREAALPWRRPQVRYARRLPFVEPIGKREDIDAALIHLLELLTQDLDEAHLGARRLVYVLEKVDGTQQSFTIGTAVAERDVSYLARLFRDPLDGAEPGFGIEAATLSAPVTEPFHQAQGTLNHRRAAGDGFVHLIDRLRQRLGSQALSTPLPVDSHLPERAQHRGDPLAPEVLDWPARLDRPPLLYSPAEPVQGDGRSRFYWRGGDYRVVTSVGPERIGPEWWQAAPGTRPRDYWRVEDTTGGRYWLYQSVEPDGRGGWYLHGVFA
ncbi:DNA polymerase Y family protein [Lacibacterium aquatile]|uniref:DNA polymerase Y family protein n=1 Tax=Lacibacterium aquatile TaxID=1168082 RepID=A0ABW5DW55_9PROT